MTYLGGAVTQIDGTRFAQQNCVLATTSCLGDSSSLGFWKISPSRLRYLSGDTFGGVDYDDAEVTMRRATDGEVDLTVIYWAPQNATTSTLDKILDAPRITGISIDAGVTRWTPYRTGTFTGGHTVTVGAKRIAKVQTGTGSYVNQKQALVMDSGHGVAKWVWWPWSLLIKAAHARTGSNTIHVIYTRDVAGVNRVAHDDGLVRSSTKVVTSPSNKVGAFTKGHTYTVVATLRGSYYDYKGKRLNGWSKLGPNRYAVAKIR